MEMLNNILPYKAEELWAEIIEMETDLDHTKILERINHAK